MSIRRQRGFLKRQADAQRSLLDGSQQGTLRIATPYKITAGRRGVLAAGGNADAGAHLHLTAQPAAAVAAGAAYDVAWDAQDAAHPAAGYATTALTLPLTALPMVVAGYYDLQVFARWATALAWSVDIIRTRASVETVVWPPAVLPEAAALTAAVGAVHVLAVELAAGDTITTRLTNDSGASGTVQAAHLSLSLVDRSRGVVTEAPPTMYVAAGGSTTRIATSEDDGVTWTTQTTPMSGIVRALAHNGTDTFVAGTSTGELATSPDAVTWTLQTSPFGTNPVTAAVWGGSQFVAVGDGGTIATSPDGIAWTTRTSPFGTDGIATVAYDGSGLYVLAGVNGQLATSPDGVTWTARTSGFGTTQVEDVVFGVGLWVIVGLGKLSTSPDGITWTSRTHPLTGSIIRTVTHGGGLYVAGAQGGRIATSPDGVTWTEVASTGIAGDLFGSTWHSDLFVVGSLSGEIATSTGGSTWTLQTSPFVASASSVRAIVGSG